MADTAQIRQFIIDNFLFGEDPGLENDTSFRDAAIMDSTGILELIAFLEETFNISIEDEELVPENLDSLAKIGQFIDRKSGSQEQRLQA